VGVHFKGYAQRKGTASSSRNKKSQAELLAAVVFLILVPTVIIAQNATNMTTHAPIDGGVIAAVNDSSQPPVPEPPANTTPDSAGGNVTGTQPEEAAVPAGNQTLPGNATAPDNATSATLTGGNATLPGDGANETPAGNQTLPENATLPEENQPLPGNATSPPVNETEPSEHPEEAALHADLSVAMDVPGSVYRGEPFAVSAPITNAGTAAAMNVSVEWDLPEGFLLVDSANPCNTILPGSGCTATARILAPLDSALVDEEIRMLVSYGG
jgi:hypothetical protein